MTMDEVKYHMARERRLVEQGMRELGLVGARVEESHDSMMGVVVHIEDLAILVQMAQKASQ